MCDWGNLPQDIRTPFRCQPVPPWFLAWVCELTPRSFVHKYQCPLGKQAEMSVGLFAPAKSPVLPITARRYQARLAIESSGNWSSVQLDVDI